MAEIKKIDVGSVVNKPLALARQGSQKMSEGVAKFQVAEKFDALKSHPIAAKVVDKVTQFSNVLWALFGFVLILHGAQFKNLFLCTQLINAFYYDRVKTSTTSLFSSVTTALEKMKADEPDGAEADAKAEAKPENKHAQKRAGKTKEVSSEKQYEEDVSVAKKALKAMDSDKLSGTAFEVFSAAMACHMVMHTHLGQAIVLAHDLVQVAKAKIEDFFEFAGLEDLSAWIDLFVRFFLYVVFTGLALIAAPLMLALDVSAVGARLALEYGARAAQAMGRIPDAEGLVGSKNGLIALAGLTTFGTLWQFWSLMAASGIAWYFKLFYFPALILETIVGCF